MIGVELSPIDTWFFRDGTPFTMGSAPQEDVGSLFPPNPPTIAGALRAAIARERGWNGKGSWPLEFCKVLGDGPDDIGSLDIEGSFLLRERFPLFQMPRHLLGSFDGRDWIPKVALHPGKKVRCDLGEVRLPCAMDEAHDAKPCLSNDYWLTGQGMKRVLNGDIPFPQQVVPRKYLWREELRIGLQRNVETRTAQEGMLYSTRHVRLHDSVSLGVRISGLPEDWRLPLEGLVPLGGENRLAEIGEWNGTLLPDGNLDVREESKQLLLIALTPVDLNGAIDVGGSLAGLKGVRVVSACLDRPQMVGGWDFRNGGTPLPSRPVLKSGSVLFCEIADESTPEQTNFEKGLVRVGSRTQSGFGLMAVGTW